MRKRGRAEAEAFVLDVFRRHGGEVAAARKNAVEVRFPEPPEFADRAEFVVAFERKALDQFPEAILASQGSPFYLKLLEYARGRGRSTRVFTPMVEPLPALPDDRMVKAPPELIWTAEATTNDPHVLFNFAISYHSVVTSDDLISIGYDVLRQRFRDPAVVEAIHSVWSETLPQSPGDWAETETPDLRELQQLVLHELDKRTRRKVVRARRNAQQHLEQEIRNVEDYYRQLIAEEREMLNRLTQTSPKEAQEREKRVRRYQLDWKRRIAEESRHHECRVHVRLISVSVIYMPRTALHVTNAAGESIARCRFNHFLGTLDGVSCSRTGSEIGPWEIDTSGRWLSRGTVGDADGDVEEVETADDSGITVRGLEKEEVET